MRLAFRGSGSQCPLDRTATCRTITIARAVQYWLSNRFNIEAGAGVGFWNAGNDEEESGLGLILGAGITLFNRGKHNLQFGVQYAPAFTDPGTVHNLGFTFGYQFL